MGGKHQAPATPSLVERLRSYYPPICQEAADALEAQQARIAELEARSEFDELEAQHLADHANRLSDRYRFLFAVLMACANDRAASLQALADRYEKALERLIEYFEDGEAHGEGAYDEGCPDCQALQLARQALSSQGRHEGGEG